MSLSGVKCSVENCQYNQKAIECTAPAIEVNVDQGGCRATAEQETMCKTFKMK